MTLNTTLARIAAAVPDPDPERPPGFEAVDTLIAWLRWGGLAAAVIGIIIVAIMLMLNNRRGEGAQQLGSLGYVLLGVILVGAASSLVGFLIG